MLVDRAMRWRRVFWVTAGCVMLWGVFVAGLVLASGCDHDGWDDPAWLDKYGKDYLHGQ